MGPKPYPRIYTDPEHTITMGLCSYRVYLGLQVDPKHHVGHRTLQKRNPQPDKNRLYTQHVIEMISSSIPTYPIYIYIYLSIYLSIVIYPNTVF